MFNQGKKDSIRVQALKYSQHNVVTRERTPLTSPCIAFREHQAPCQRSIYRFVYNPDVSRPLILGFLGYDPHSLTYTSEYFKSSVHKNFISRPYTTGFFM